MPLQAHRIAIAVVVVVAATACASSGGETVDPSSIPPIAGTATTAESTTITAPATTAAPPVAPDDAVARWAEDMAVLADGVRRIHPDPFWRQPEGEFDASLAAAPATLATLDDGDARAEVMRLMAGIDGHSGIYLGDAGFHLYDLRLYEADGSYVVVDGGDPSLFGATVLSISDVPIAQAAAAVTPYSPFDNAATVRNVVATLLVTAEVLHAAGVATDPDEPAYRVRLADGTETVVRPRLQSWDDAIAEGRRPVGIAEIDTIATLARLDEPFWTSEFATGPAGGRTLYLQYNQVVRRTATTSIDDVAAGLATALDSGVFTRLVVDVRFNTGGQYGDDAPLVEMLTNHPKLTQPGALVVLIGRQTFSAGVLFVAALQRQAAPVLVLVGEPTGGSPNFYADPETVTLPNSGLVVHVSSKYFEGGGPTDRREAIEPDLAATTTVADLLASRDPALEAALALP